MKLVPRINHRQTARLPQKWPRTSQGQRPRRQSWLIAHPLHHRCCRQTTLRQYVIQSCQPRGNDLPNRRRSLRFQQFLPQLTQLQGSSCTRQHGKSPAAVTSVCKSRIHPTRDAPENTSRFSRSPPPRILNRNQRFRCLSAQMLQNTTTKRFPYHFAAQPDGPNGKSAPETTRAHNAAIQYRSSAPSPRLLGKLMLTVNITIPGCTPGHRLRSWYRPRPQRYNRRQICPAALSGFWLDHFPAPPLRTSRGKQ